MPGVVELVNSNSSANFYGLKVQTRKIKAVFFAEKVVSTDMRIDFAPDLKVEFKKVHSGILGRDVYLIVETENFVPAGHNLNSNARDEIKIELKTRDTRLTGQQMQTLAITNGHANTTKFITRVGDTNALNDINGACDYTNLNDFKDKAIFKLSLRPHDRANFNKWAKNIKDSGKNLPAIAIQVSAKDTNLESHISYGKGNNIHRPPYLTGFFSLPGGAEFTIENKNVYEIYHGENKFNPFGYHTVNNTQVKKRLGKIASYYTDTQNQRISCTDDIAYFYHDINDNQIEMSTLTKNRHGLVLFPDYGDGFGRYGTVDAGGYDNIIPEYVGRGDHYLHPITAAALFGVTQEVHARGWNIDFGDMSSSNGRDPWQFSWVTPSNTNTTRGHHSGHGHLGRRAGLDVDFRFLDTNGNSFQGTSNDRNFDDKKNIELFQIAFDYGFHINYATNKNNYAGVNPNVGGHYDHGHWGLGRTGIEIII